MSTVEPGRRTPNALGSEKSPYLRQHAFNPVDWMPWGPDALARAAALDKPIFLSVGYAACHWCHVMERESFENQTIADIVNQHFVCIKVDREERPDIDEIYMTAVQRMTGHGGWPMSVFLTPDGRPFYGGTYFPPTRRQGRIGFLELTTQLAEAWHERREEVESVADTLCADLQESTRQRPLPSPGGALDAGQLLQDAVSGLEDRFDPEYGGFGDAPKFPPHHALRLLCRALAGGDTRAAALLTITLDRMAQGGLYDHVGGGFHRYCTDRVWLLPHFEKMLYDNALLARVYADAGELLGNPAWLRVARETCDWVIDTMREPEGGFVAAWDADSEGEEGRYYVWSRAEAEALAGTAWCDRYQLTPEGNFHDEATGRRTGMSIPHLGLGPEAPRLPDSLTPEECAGREALRAARARRVPPLRDHKVLASWNGLMIGALARCGAVLDEPRYVEIARDAARFCLGPLSPDGHLMHRWAEGEAAIPAFLDDMAYLADGLLDLADATGESVWRTSAEKLAQAILDDFRDDEDGGFFFASEHRHERLVARSKDLFDGALPSANGVAMRVLARLGGRFADEAHRIGEIYTGVMARAPQATSTLIEALGIAGDAPATDVESVRGHPSGVAPTPPVDHSNHAANTPVAVLLGHSALVVSAGGRHRMPITIRVADSIHIGPGDDSAGMVQPSRIAISGLPATLDVVSVEWPEPVEQDLAGARERVFVGEIVVNVNIQCDLSADPESGIGRIELNCQPCTDRYCLAPTTIAVDLPWRIAP